VVCAETEAEEEAMTAYDDSRTCKAMRNMYCHGCQKQILRRTRYLRFYKTAWWQPWHIDCARAAGLNVKCLEPKKR
jgi:hypothetical protein